MTIRDVRLENCPMPIEDGEFRCIVGYNLKVLRENKGVSRKELAERLGKSPHTIDALEVGKIFPKIPTLSRLATYYNVTTDEILGRFAVKEKLRHEWALEKAIWYLSQFGKVERESDSYRFRINKLEICNGELHEVNKSVKFTDVTLVRFVELLTEEALATNKTFEQLLNEKIAGLSDDKTD